MKRTGSISLLLLLLLLVPATAFEHAGFRAWAFVATRPRLYALLTRVAARVLKLWGGRSRRIGDSVVTLLRADSGSQKLAE